MDGDGDSAKFVLKKRITDHDFPPPLYVGQNNNRIQLRKEATEKRTGYFLKSKILSRNFQFHHKRIKIFS